MNPKPLSPGQRNLFHVALKCSAPRRRVFISAALVNWLMVLKLAVLAAVFVTVAILVMVYPQVLPWNWDAREEQRNVKQIEEGLRYEWLGPGPMPVEVREKVWPTTPTITPAPTPDRRKPRPLDPPERIDK